MRGFAPAFLAASLLFSIGSCGGYATGDEDSDASSADASLVPYQ